MRSQLVPPASRCPARWTARLPQRSFSDRSKALHGPIVHPTDLTTNSLPAFELAKQLGTRPAEPPRRAARGSARANVDGDGSFAAASKRTSIGVALQAAMPRPCRRRIRVEYRVEEGDVAAGILDVARGTALEPHCHGMPRTKLDDTNARWHRVRSRAQRSVPRFACQYATRG